MSNTDTATRPNKGSFSKKENLKQAKEGQVKRAPRGITEGEGLMASMTGLNLSRLFANLVDPDRHMSDLDKQMAEYIMNTISSGAKTQNRPDYEHKGEGKPDVKKPHEKSNPKPKKTNNGIPKVMFSGMRGR